MPHEIPTDAVVWFEKEPYIASMKFSIRAKCPRDPSSLSIYEMHVERYDERESLEKISWSYDIDYPAVG